MRLRISDEARRDLRALHVYGAETYGQGPADEYIDAITLAMERIRTGRSPTAFGPRFARGAIACS